MNQKASRWGETYQWLCDERRWQPDGFWNHVVFCLTIIFVIILIVFTGITPVPEKEVVIPAVEKSAGGVSLHYQFIDTTREYFLILRNANEFPVAVEKLAFDSGILHTEQVWLLESNGVIETKSSRFESLKIYDRMNGCLLGVILLRE